jgi:uncharacterized protein (TIGR02246 family)
MRRIVILVVVMLFTLWLSGQPPANAGGGREEAALRELWSQFEGAFNQYDANKVASLYAPDGDRINADFEVARGRAEIAKQYEKEFDRRKSDASTVPLHAKLAIRLLRDDVAILDGEWQGFLSGKKVRGQFTVIAQKGPKGWQIASGRVRGTKDL